MPPALPPSFPPSARVACYGGGPAPLALVRCGREFWLVQIHGATCTTLDFTTCGRKAMTFVDACMAQRAKAAFRAALAA